MSWIRPYRIFTLLVFLTTFFVACTQITATPTDNTETLDASYVKGSGYVRAMQLGFYFFEAQQSGNLSVTNRVPWRGPAHLDDGKDVTRDLSGGWYDAGDLWKTNSTMAFASSMLAWSALQFPAAYDKTAQWEELRDSLKHVNDYFLRCIVDPAPKDLTNFNGYQLYVDVGGTYIDTTGNEQPKPSVHSMWAAPEVTDGFTLREATKVNTEIAGPDVAAAMSAAMASSAIVFSNAGERRYARILLIRARKLFAYAERYPFETQERDLTVNGELPVIDPKGNTRPLGYRSMRAADEQLFAAAWLYKAELALGGDRADTYFNWANTFISNPANHPEGKNNLAGGYETLGSFVSWWADPNVGEYASPAILLWLMNRPDTFAGLESYLYVPNPESQYDTGLFDSWLNNPLGEHLKTPGGLSYRIWWGDGFLLHRNMHVSFMALVYSNWTSDTLRKNKLYAWAKKQMNYALGSNPSGTSYVIGYGSRWPQRPLHGGASGFWSGFDNANPNSSCNCYQTKGRHTLYGALVGGPKRDDSFPDEWTDYVRSEPTLYGNASMAGVLAALVAKEASPGTTDSILPPPSDAVRNNSLEWKTTDREFFGEAKVVSQTATRLQLDTFINNRSRWSPRITDKLSMRFFITLSAGTTPSDVRVRLVSSEGGTLKPLTQWSGQTYFFDLDFTGQRILPSFIYQANTRPGKANILTDSLYRRAASVDINIASGKSLETSAGSLTGLTSTMQIRPGIAVYDAGRLVGGEEMSR